MKILHTIRQDAQLQKERLKVATHNVAHASVFGAKAKAVVASSTVNPALTHAKHLGTFHRFKTVTVHEKPDPSYNNNTIDPDKELKNAANAATDAHRDLALENRLYAQLMALIT